MEYSCPFVVVLGQRGGWASTEGAGGALDCTVTRRNEGAAGTEASGQGYACKAVAQSPRVAQAKTPAATCTLGAHASLIH